MGLGRLVLCGALALFCAAQAAPPCSAYASCAECTGHECAWCLTSTNEERCTALDMCPLSEAWYDTCGEVSPPGGHSSSANGRALARTTILLIALAFIAFCCGVAGLVAMLVVRRRSVARRGRKDRESAQESAAADTALQLQSL
eukprot:m51a1_g11060 hypothetical protein (144) ;mRNA; r:525885-526573